MWTNKLWVAGGTALWSGKWKTARTVFETLGNSFVHKNGVLFGIGLGLLAVGIVASFFKKKLKKRKWTRYAYRGTWVLSALFLVLSLMTGDGHGLGFGNGSGVGIGEGAGAGIGSAVGVGSDGEDGTTPAFASSNGEISIRIHYLEVTVDEKKIGNAEELSVFLSESYEDGMKITVWDDYADNQPYLWVTETLERLAMPFEFIKNNANTGGD